MSDERALPYADNEALLDALRHFGEMLTERASLAEERIEREWSGIVARMAATLEQRIFVPWIHVAAMFRLGAVDQHLLLLALLAESDERYRKRLQGLTIAVSDDAGGAAPAAEASSQEGVPLAVLTRMFGDVRLNLLPDAPLQHGCLIDAADANVAAMTGSYRLAPPLAAYLLGLAAPQLHIDDTMLADIRPDCPFEEHLIDDAAKRQLARFVDACGARAATPVTFMLHLQGVDLALMSSLCASALAQLGYAAARLDGKRLRRAYEASGARRATLMKNMRLLCRDAVICNQVLVLTDCQWLVANGERDAQDDLLDDVLHVLFETQRYLAVLNGQIRRLAESVGRFAYHDVVPLRVRVEPPSVQLRRLAWLKHAERHALPIDVSLLEQLADGYPFEEERIATVLKDVVGRRMLGDPTDALPQVLVEACRAEAEAEQLGIAKELRMPHRLGDIVLPGDTLDVLDELLSHVRHRAQVVDEWGFRGKYAGSRNLSVLFHGPPGTGKTMAASIVANELELSLYRVDLASVLSKYIGETEQHLAQLFDRAEAMNVVLFFDEAEGLFGKRTETRDAHDRYANLQIGYLLQRIESYPGIVILSTNLLRNMDKAFLRRFRFVIEFPFPVREERRRLWQQAFPPAVPLARDVDFDLLAERASLAGGSIQNVALSAAFRAAADSAPVDMRHLLKSLEREYVKLGKVFVAGDFSRSGG